MEIHFSGDWSNWMEQHGVRLESVAGTVLILLVACVIILILSRLLRHLLVGLRPRLRLPYETVLLITRSFGGLLWLCTFMLVLDFWGVGVGGLWTFLVSVATVVGVGFLAVWTMVSNVTASFFITLWRPFRLGQIVELLPEGLSGRVIDRNAMFTVLREGKGRTLQIPNNLFFQKIFRVTAAEEQYWFEYLEPERQPAPPEQRAPADERTDNAA
jgi:small-conductance mechanosensitive channel